MNGTTLSSDNPSLRLGRAYYKISISEKIKRINKTIGKNKPQYDLDGQTAQISVLTSENVSKYEYLTSKDVLPELRFTRKRCCNKKI